MAAKPTQDPKWVTSDDPVNIIEPTAPLKTNGIISGGIWGREHLNWMFNAISKWIDWVRSYAMDKDNNLSDVSNPTTAFNNIKQNATTTVTGVVEQATAAEITSGTSSKFPDAAGVKTAYVQKSDNLSTVSNATTSFNNIKQNATTTTTGVVEKATAAEVTSGTTSKFPDAADIKTVYLQKADNLSTVANASVARTNLGTNNAANLTTGTVPVARLPSATTTAKGAVEKATVAEVTLGTSDKYPDAAGVKGEYLSKADNLGGLVDKSASRVNLGANNASNLTTGTISSSRLPTATLTTVGGVEKATLSELNAGAADKYPDAAGVIYQLSTYYVQKTNVVDDLVSTDTDKPLSANQGKILNDKSQSAVVSGSSLGFSGGSLDIIREGKIVTVSGNITHPSASSVSATTALPSWAHPANTVRNLHDDGTSLGYNSTTLSTSGTIFLSYRTYAGATTARNLSSVSFSYGVD